MTEEKLPTAATVDWADSEGDVEASGGDLAFPEIKADDELVQREKVDEILPVIAHRLWWYWSQHIAEEEEISDERLDRWKDLWKPFEELSDEMQEKDRELVESFFKGELIEEVQSSER